MPALFIIRHLSLVIFWLLASACGLSAAQPDPPAPTAAPFLRLREATLNYHGPEGDLTNLSEIRIGWFGPTNLDDPLTGDLWWAASLALREANAQQNPQTNASSGHSPFFILHSPFRSLPFRLVPRWAVDPWGTGVSQLARMVYDQQPLALLGSVDSASTHLAEQVVAKANLPLVSPIATDKSVTLAGVSWMFSCAPADDAIARVLVDGILATSAGLESGRASKLALLTCTDHESRMTAREVLREFARRGRVPDLRFEAPPGGADLARQMERLAVAEPAIVLVVAGPEDAARWVKALHETVPSARVFGSQALGRARFRELAGPAAEGARFPLLFTANPSDPRYARFASRFQAERGRSPDYAAVLTYDATCLLLEAIHQAGPNRARVREALHQLSPWAGLAGPIQFDGTGQNTRTNLCLGTVRNGLIAALSR